MWSRRRFVRQSLACACVLCLVLVIGCSQQAAMPPDEVARQFVAAVASGDTSAASKLAGQELSEADLSTLRESWLETTATADLEYVSLASTGIEGDGVTYQLTEIQLVDDEPQVLESEDTVHAVYLMEHGSQWTVVNAE